MQDFVNNVIAGLISGVVSGLLVYCFTKKREEKYRLYYYWQDYLFKVMEKNEVYMPTEQLRNISAIGDKGSKWYQSVFEILNLTNPFEIQEKEFSEEGTKLAENVLIALNELGKWAKKNKLKL